MAHVKDYQGPTVGNKQCTYSSLGNIYSGATTQNQMNTSQSNYIVPKLCSSGDGPNYPPKYNTLSHNQSYQCGGYFNISGAYPYSKDGQCNVSYVEKPCSSHSISCGTAPKAPTQVEETYRRRY